jgi:hypothetical protein
VPVNLIKLLPLNAESNATDTTVPGRMKGAMIDKSSNTAPLGFFLSVM